MLPGCVLCTMSTPSQTSLPSVFTKSFYTGVMWLQWSPGALATPASWAVSKSSDAIFLTRWKEPSSLAFQNGFLFLPGISPPKEAGRQVLHSFSPTKEKVLIIHGTSHVAYVFELVADKSVLCCKTTEWVIGWRCGEAPYTSYTEAWL